MPTGDCCKCTLRIRCNEQVVDVDWHDDPCIAALIDVDRVVAVDPLKTNHRQDQMELQSPGSGPLLDAVEPLKQPQNPPPEILP